MTLTLSTTTDGAATADGLRDLRTAAGLSQQRLAELAGCSISTVRLYEAGHRATSETLGKLAAALGCSLADLTNDQRRPIPAGAGEESRGAAGYVDKG